MPKRKASKWGVYVLPPWGYKARIGSVRARNKAIALGNAKRKFPNVLYPICVELLVK